MAMPRCESNHEPVLHGLSRSQPEKHSERDQQGDEHWLAFLVVHFNQPFALP